MVGIFDPPRQGVTESIEVVQSAGVKVKMVTGDSYETACSIGMPLNFCNISVHFFFEVSFFYLKRMKRLYFYAEFHLLRTFLGARLQLFNTSTNCLSGPQIDQMTDVELESVIREVSIFYRSSPKHKLRIVKVFFTFWCLIINFFKKGHLTYLHNVI